MGGKGSGRKVGPCGTPAKYQWHWKRGESCEICKRAAAADRNRRNGIKRAQRPKKVRIPRGSAFDRNRELVRTEKLRRGQCADCGVAINERTIVFIDFDHRDPAEKSFTISHEGKWAAMSDLINEMAKCDAVCRNCHALRTHDNRHFIFRKVATFAPTLFDVDGLHG